ncbi:hypothetical protein Taro_011282 [Colocasia esculenta]|uniref:Uncharacterized protein n=1 Tax=Colocasia esculenta TaxID=4460 RepID=A0A843U5F7_COLES|nr:hypothetical protein [Colocasia esculenta]
MTLATVGGTPMGDPLHPIPNLTEKVKIPADKPFIFLEGEGREHMVIEWGAHAGADVVVRPTATTTDDSATFTVHANNFTARWISFKTCDGGEVDGWKRGIRWERKISDDVYRSWRTRPSRCSCPEVIMAVGGGRRPRPALCSPERKETSIEPIGGVGNFLREFAAEFRKLRYFAGPAIFTSIYQYSLGAITQMVAGQVGTLELAVVSVENSVIAGFSFGVMLGMGNALETLCGQAYGAGQLDMQGVFMQAGFFFLRIA